MNNNLKNLLKDVPEKPGIYFWYGQKREILYIGRAINLKNRLKQYFQKNINSRIAEMVAQAKDLKFITCNNLLETIILEAVNIKKYWPKYNIIDRDNRSFVYIVINLKEEYPKPIIIRGQDLKKIPTYNYKIFGPYQSYRLISDALRLLRKIFPYSTCKPNQGKACFDYQIGLCPGICINAINSKEYKKNIKKLILVLNGERQRLLSKLEKDNPEQAKALNHLQEVSLLKIEDDLQLPTITRIEGYDISHFQGKETYASMVVFINNEKQTNEYRLFKIKEAPEKDDERALLEVLKRRYQHKDWPSADMIIIDGGSPQINFLTKELKKLNIILPLVGISKFSDDKLIFPSGVKKNFKDLAETIKPVLLKTREEAHRFANYGRKRKMRLTIF